MRVVLNFDVKVLQEYEDNKYPLVPWTEKDKQTHTFYCFNILAHKKNIAQQSSVTYLNIISSEATLHVNPSVSIRLVEARVLYK